MTRFSFNLTSPPLDVTYTKNNLSTQEFEIVNSITSWKNPNKYSNNVYQVAGRSIFIKNPTIEKQNVDNVNEKYSGLQIIGSGGNLSFVTSGITIIPELIQIEQVKEENAVKEIPNIFETREITSDGDLKTSSKEYVPLMGMDTNEAHERKTNTQIFLEMSRLRNGTKRPPFVTPDLVLEGKYNSLRDNTGKNLRFQVYKVPEIPRFASQFIDHLINTETIDVFLKRFFYLQGLSLRNVNENGFAYTQPHMDNFSLLKNKNKSILYMTDLGSLKKIENDSQRDKYISLDLYIVGLSSSKFFREVFQESGLFPKKIGKDLSFKFLSTSFSTFMKAYHTPELQNNTLKSAELNQKIKYSIEYILENNYQGFLNNF